MTSEIESDQTHAGRRPVHAERLTEIAAQAVLEDKRQAVAFFAVVETQTITIEERHRLSSLPENDA